MKPFSLFILFPTGKYHLRVDECAIQWTKLLFGLGCPASSVVGMVVMRWVCFECEGTAIFDRSRGRRAQIVQSRLG